jgi:hypothetical protein
MLTIEVELVGGTFRAASAHDLASSGATDTAE